MTDWPCHVWLQKKLVLLTNKAALGVCYRLLCTNLGDGILCTLWPNHNIHEVNGVYQRWTTYALKSKSVVEINFPGIWRSKFTDFAGTKLNLWEKTAVDKSAWIKDWTCLSKSLRISILPISFRLALPQSLTSFSSANHLLCLYALFLMLFRLTQMSFMRSIHLLMCLSSETLMPIMKTH